MPGGGGGEGEGLLGKGWGSQASRGQWRRAHAWRWRRGRGWGRASGDAGNLAPGPPFAQPYPRHDGEENAPAQHDKTRSVRFCAFIQNEEALLEHRVLRLELYPKEEVNVVFVEEKTLEVLVDQAGQDGQGSRASGDHAIDIGVRFDVAQIVEQLQDLGILGFDQDLNGFVVLRSGWF